MKTNIGVIISIMTQTPATFAASIHASALRISAAMIQDTPANQVLAVVLNMRNHSAVKRVGYIKS